MKLFFTESFIRDYRSLPSHIQKTADKQLEFFLAKAQHPSLHIKKMQDPRSIWEGRITKGYRFTFQIEGEVYILRRIGTHDMLRQP
jgi:mRNA-degrading endonuclease RelE of RelBE toxin-antitoxin system